MKVLFSLAILALVSGCATSASSINETASGRTLHVDTASVSNPLAPSVTGVVMSMCDSNNQNCEELEHGVYSQTGWLDPSTLGAAAMISYGLRGSGTEVNQTGGGASASATGGEGGTAAAGANATGGTAVSNSTSKANAAAGASSNVNNVNNVSGGGGGCFPPGHCK